MRDRIKGNVGLLLAVLLTVVIVVYSWNGRAGREDLKAQQTRDSRAYSTNDQDVRYFVTCVEGFKWIATDGYNGRASLAGPIGRCPTDRDKVRGERK